MYLPDRSIEHRTTMVNKMPLFFKHEGFVESCCTAAAAAGRKYSIGFKDNMMCLLYVTLALSFFPKWRSSSCIIPSNTFLRPFLHCILFFVIYYIFVVVNFPLNSCNLFHISLIFSHFICRFFSLITKFKKQKTAKNNDDSNSRLHSILYKLQLGLTVIWKW